MTVLERCDRIATTTHIVYSDDSTIHTVDGINVIDDEVYVSCKDGMMFLDLDVFTLEEAANVERRMINITKLNGIKYND
jgi:hypothetical protein